jgi:putative transposase
MDENKATWTGQTVQAKAKAQEDLHAAIRQQSIHHKQRYGRPRMTDQLKKLGFSVNHKRLGKDMKRLDLQCKLRRKYKICTTDSKRRDGVSQRYAQSRMCQSPELQDTRASTP